MDITEKKILEMLSKNADTTATEIGDSVNLSIPAVNKRIQKLRNDGIIRHFTILTDGEKVGRPIIAFILIVAQAGSDVEELLEYIEQGLDILECYTVTGEYDYFIKLCAPDVKSIENKLLYLKRHKGIVKSHTMLSLVEHKFQPTIL